LNKEDEAVQDVLKGVENDWRFAVNQFARVDPIVGNFTASNGTTMSVKVANVSTKVGDFVSKVNPVLQWATKGLQTLLDADAADNAKLTNDTDTAAHRVLYQAMTVGQIFPHQVNMYAKNMSAFADRYFNT
jgi:hypothetical protein